MSCIKFIYYFLTQNKERVLSDTLVFRLVIFVLFLQELLYICFPLGNVRKVKETRFH